MNPVVRPYRDADRASVRRIAFDTALMGRSASVFFEGEEFFKDLLTVYFTDHEPNSAWVAEVDGVVVGYVIGARDERLMKKTFLTKILPGLLVEFFSSGILLKEKNLKLLRGIFKSLLEGEFSVSGPGDEYPAVLHINISEQHRGLGVGASLLAVLVDVFAREGVKGIHLATMSERGSDFFCTNGFKLLYKGKRSYLSESSGREVPLYVFVRKLL